MSAPAATASKELVPASTAARGRGPSPDGSPSTSSKEEDLSLLPLAVVAKKVATDLDKGLSAAEVDRRRARDGLNELKTRARPPIWRIFLANCSNALMILLIISAIVSLAVGDYAEGVAILVTILVNASLATYTEQSSGDALAALLDMTAPTCNVRRTGPVAAAAGHELAGVMAGSVLARDAKTSGVEPPDPLVSAHEVEDDVEAGGEDAGPAMRTVASRDLVVGDIVLLSGGSVVPADIRLIEASDARFDESMLTGESKEVTKTANWQPSPDGKTEPSPGNMLFSGTHMSTGRAVGIVVAIGMQTRLGRIAALLLTGGDKDDEDEDKDEDDESDDDEDEESREEVSLLRNEPPNSKNIEHEYSVSRRGAGGDLGGEAEDTVQADDTLQQRHKKMLRRKLTQHVLDMAYDPRKDSFGVHDHAFFDASVHTIKPRDSSVMLAELRVQRQQTAMNIRDEHKTSVAGTAMVPHSKEPEIDLARSKTSIKKLRGGQGPQEHDKLVKGGPDAAAAAKKKKAKKKTQTPLQQSLSRLGLQMSVAALIACIIVFVVGISRSYRDPAHPNDPIWLVMLLTAVSLAVSAIPEGLPLAVTICLAMGSKRLAEAKTLVRQLPAVEALGMVTVMSVERRPTTGAMEAMDF